MDKFRVNFSQHSLIILSDFHVPDPDLPRHYYWLADCSRQTCGQCRRFYGSPVKGATRLPAQNQASILTGTIRPVLVAGRPIVHKSPRFPTMQSLSLSDAQNLGLCAARRAVNALGVSQNLYIREEQSCLLWAGIAETIRAQAQASSARFHLADPDPVGDLPLN